jgi:hypothetical protein
VFHKTLEWAKNHPIIIAFIVGGVVLVLLLSGGSSNADSGGAVVAGGPSDAQVAAGTQLSLAQMGYAAQANQTNAQLGAVQIGAQRDVQIASLSADVAHYQTEQAANVQTIGISAQRDVALAGYQTQEVIALGQAAAAVEGQRIAADITKTGYAAQTQQLQIFTGGQIAINQQNANATVALAQVDQKRAEVDRFYDYKSGKSSGGGIAGLVGGILGSIF